MSPAQITFNIQQYPTAPQRVLVHVQISSSDVVSAHPCQSCLRTGQPSVFLVLRGTVCGSRNLAAVSCKVTIVSFALTKKSAGRAQVPAMTPCDKTAVARTLCALSMAWAVKRRRA